MKQKQMIQERGKDAAVQLSAAEHRFSTVEETCRPQIFRFLLASLRDADLAETLTQECFLKAYRNWLSFRDESSVMTWLMRIAINLQKDHWRNRRMQFWRQRRANPVDMDRASEWLPSGERSPEEYILAREQVEKVWKVVACLSERQRTVFLLRFVEDLELREIAQAAGLEVDAVKAHLSRALLRVHAALNGR
jgi:RNA polymerase sigma-70 factor (ECF subfamily)